MSNLVVYKDGELELEISIQSENVWLNAEEISIIFNVNRPAIVKHIGNIYKDEELDQKSTCSIMEQVAKDGKLRKINYYNLDMIISVGYRVNSKKATKFRQWATTVLKKYIEQGFSINTHKITEQRLNIIENELEKIKSLIKNNTLEVKQGIFFNGQIFDAYVFISNLIKSSKTRIILIDNYIDETVLTLLTKNRNVNILIYTQLKSKRLILDIKKFKKQYSEIEIKNTNNFHDRFIIIDNDVYHIGASLKDLGNKSFAFSKINIDPIELLDKA